MTQCNVLIELEAFINTLTDDQIVIGMENVPEPQKGETVAAVITSDFCRRLATAMGRLRALSTLQQAQACLEGGTRGKELQIAASRQYALRNLADILFWSQVKDDHDLWLADEPADRSGFGLRSEWRIVTMPEFRGPQQLMRKLMGTEPE